MPGNLALEHCQELAHGSPALARKDIVPLLSCIPDWQLDANQCSISKQFAFTNYYQTIAFANAVAWIAQQEDHHPDMLIKYKHCTITWSTHRVNGLSRNDFICAAKVNALFAEHA